MPNVVSGNTNAASIMIGEKVTEMVAAAEKTGGAQLTCGGADGRGPGQDVAGAVIEEVRKLRRGIREHRDSSGHELCWHHPALWGLLPETQDPLPTVPEWPAFLRGCIRYRQSLDELAPAAPRSSQPSDR